MSNKVLVISNQNDDHISMVSSLSSLEFVLFDPTDFVYNMERLSFRIDKNGIFHGIYENHNLDDFKVFWFRKPKFIQENEYPVDKGLQEHCRDNYHRFMNTLFSVYSNKFWFNHPDANRNAEVKFKQLMVAKSVGFNIRDTLVSNFASDALMFISDKKIVAAKSLSQRRIDLAGQYLNGPLTEIEYSNSVKETLLEKEVGLRINPYIFQEFIDGVVHRVIVVDKQIYSIKTIPLKPELRLDSRAIMAADEYSLNVISEIPDSVKKMCLNYLDSFGLKYGAFDLIETPNGEFMFLECNPNGQWGFVDMLAENNNIATAIARLFESV